MIGTTRKYWLDTWPEGQLGTCGDFAMQIEPGPDRRIILVGDVAGRGQAVGAAAAALKAYMLMLVSAGASLSTTVLAADEFFRRVLLKEETPFATLFIAKLDTRLEVIDYVSAGHEPALLIGLFGQYDALAPTGPILGLDFNRPAEFGEKRLPLAEEQTLVVVTDGITEARRSNGSELEFFGSAGVVRAIQDARRTQRDPAAEVHASALRHMGGHLRDDTTVVVSGHPFTAGSSSRPREDAPRRRYGALRGLAPGARRFTGIQ